MSAAVPGAVERTDPSGPVARMRRQLILDLLVPGESEQSLLHRASKHALKRLIRGALEDMPHRIPDVPPNLRMPGCLRFARDLLQLRPQIVRDRPAPQHVRRGKRGKYRRIAPPLPGDIQEGQRIDQRGRGLVAPLKHKCSVIRVRFHLIDDHLRHRIPGLEGIAHSQRTLGRAIAHHRNTEIERHAAVFPDSARGLFRGRIVREVRRLIRRSSDNRDPGGIRIQPLADLLQRMRGVSRPIQQARHRDRLVRLALHFVVIGVAPPLDLYHRYGTPLPEFKRIRTTFVWNKKSTCFSQQKCLSLRRKNGSGAGTRTPDTRIMIPLL